MGREDYIVEIPGLVPETVTVALKDDLTITDDLTVEIDRCAAQFGYYAVLAERASARFQRLKYSYDLWLAEAETDLLSEGRKFRLVKDLEREIIRMPKAKLYRMKLLKFEEESKILKQVAKAFEIKKDLIQTKSSNRRSEIGA
jgi:hypothetical protein